MTPASRRDAPSPPSPGARGADPHDDAPPPSTPHVGLEEVERALSTLQGRHPEHLRIQRETQELAERQKVLKEQNRVANIKKTIRRLLMGLVYLCILGVLGFIGWKYFQRTQNVQADLKPLERPWISSGFAEVASNFLTAVPSLKVEVPATSCFVAVSTSSGPLHVQIGAGVANGSRSVNFCSCDGGLVSIEATDASGPVGVALMRIDARAFGGVLARANPAFPESTWVDGGRACADAVLDGWITERQYPRATVDDAWIQAKPERAALQRASFHAVSTVEPGHPLGVVAAAAGDCVLAVADKNEDLSLRATGGTWLMQHARGAMAWCDSAAATTTVWREGSSRVLLLEGPATAGGLLGVREIAEAARVHVEPSATWLKDADLTWDAGLLLRASKLTVSRQEVIPAEPGAPVAGIVAVATGAGTLVMQEPANALMACDPKLDAASGQREAVCAHTTPIAWWRKNDLPASWAYSPLPAWMTVLEVRHEPDALARIPELITLARRLGREGYEPTTLEGVTELPGGVRIMGRAHEDAVVAVGLGPAPPWVFPYTDKDPWDLGDAPRSVAITPGKTVVLHTYPAQTAPEETRRTIVFRHAAAQ
jgi:hypothetical protein